MTTANPTSAASLQDLIEYHAVSHKNLFWVAILVDRTIVVRIFVVRIIIAHIN